MYLTRTFLFEGTIPPSPPQSEVDSQSSPDDSSTSNIRFHVTVEENDDDGDNDVDMRTASGDDGGDNT